MFNGLFAFVAGMCGGVAFLFIVRVITPTAAYFGRKIRLTLKEFYIDVLHRLGLRIDPSRRVWELRRMILLSPIRPKLIELDRRDTDILRQYTINRNEHYGHDMRPYEESVLTSFFGVAVVPNQAETKLVGA
jgi:hypothetical protein